MENRKNARSLAVTFIGSILIALVLILDTIWTGHRASQGAQDAVNSVSLMYLDELTERHQQVVMQALDNNFRNMEIAINMLTEEDLSDIEHLQAYQTRIKDLYSLDRFAFIDQEGLVYTSHGTTNDVDKYKLDYSGITKPQITVRYSESRDQNIVVIAIPVNRLTFGEETLTVCFIEIGVDVIRDSLSLQSDNAETTLCNIYTGDGTALTDKGLGTLSSSENLLDAMSTAEYTHGNSFEKIVADFEEGNDGSANFIYKGINETISYRHIEGTDWMLTYIVRENVIANQMGSLPREMVLRSAAQAGLTAVILFVMFWIIFRQNQSNIKLAVEKETSDTEKRVMQEEMEHRLALQEKLLEQKRQRTQQDNMINALSSDYRSVYYVRLDTDECICYRSNGSSDNAPRVGQHFSYKELFSHYAAKTVAESYRAGFLEFIDPDNIRKRLENETILAYRYLTIKDGRESYEMVRVASVRNSKDKKKNKERGVHTIGLGFTDIDTEMRESMAKSQALSDALNAAEEASKAKTAFLSNMSHEIRTPMNAIIGLDSIALNDDTISPTTRDYLEKIGASANHLLEIINDILDMSRIESGRMVLKNEVFSFSEMMKQINTIFSSQCTDKGLHYKCRINGTIDDAYIGDNMKLRQILINILGNAVKFTPEGGNVEFTVERTAQFDKNSTLRFTISDTGIGMTKDYLPKIFETFSQEDNSATNKYGSTGLGMAITKNIVEMMNGNIQVESEKDKGTTFTVTVTLMDCAHTKDETDELERRIQEMRVLVIDDDPIACDHAKLVLEKAGIGCDIALSGAQAIEMVRVCHAKHEPYDLILVDLKMPEMDGVETTREIRKIVGHESAIIIITAYKWDDVLEEAINAGVDSFIAKPLFANNVIEEFKSALRKKNLAENKKQHKADLKGRHILLAEDVQINAEIMQMVLAMREMVVDHAENGRIAVEKFTASEPGYYDAILMDIRMPEMDGLEAAAAIRALDRPDAAGVPIIALTANAFDENVQNSLQAGMNAHLNKPIDNDTLFATLEEMIE